MSWETARRAVDFSLDQCLARARFVRRPPSAQLGFFGGEPLLEWDLLRRATEYAEVRASAQGIQLSCTVTTNMSLLDDERTDWLVAHRFFIGLSLDGHAEMHDTLRRWADGGGSHAHCAPALRRFTGPGARAEAILVADPRNVAFLADGVRWLGAQDLRRISINPNFYISWPPAARASWRRAYGEIGRWYMDRYRAGEPVMINFIVGKIRTRLKGGFEDCDRCGFGEAELAIAPSGRIYPCERLVADDTNESMVLGDIFQGFDRARRARVLAGRGNRNPECGDCAIRERCMNWCGCINYATTGSPDRVDGIVCFHERLAVEVADQVAGTLFAEKNPAFLREFYSVDEG